MKRELLSVAIGAAASLLVASSAVAGTLDDVKTKGFLQCGVSQGLIGFSNADEQNNWTGLDVDFCRAIASAIFNDPKAVKFTALSAKERFTALQSGEIDVLSRNTTWTMSRDTSLGLKFAGVMYYDGQGFMVNPAALKQKTGVDVKSAADLNGASVCIQTGTTTELNLADYFRSNNMTYKVVAFEKNEEVLKAYEEGRCDAYTTDQSGLYAETLKLPDPDDQWCCRRSSPRSRSARRCGRVTMAGSTSSNGPISRCSTPRSSASPRPMSRSMKSSTNPEIKRLLGAEGDFGKGIGLENDWVVQHRQGRRQLRRNLRAQCRRGHHSEDRPRQERPVEQGRSAIRAADPLRREVFEGPRR